MLFVKVPRGSIHFSAGKLLYASILALIVFTGGMLCQRYKLFPYFLVDGLVKKAKQGLVYKAAVENTAIQDQYVIAGADVDLTRDIDTALIPLKQSGIKVSSHYKFPSAAGGITIVGSAVVIVDRLGNVYAYENGTLTKRLFPPLPNNIEKFVAQPNAELTPTTLRVHDVEYIAVTKALAVSHEYFDDESKATCLAVSTIGLTEGALEPSGSWKTIFRGDLLRVSPYAGLGGGGRMAENGSGKLYLTTGDYNQDGVMIASPKVAQDPNSSFGKVIEIDLVTGKYKCISLGHRNPQGLLLTSDGKLLSTEHGPAGGDELNEITQGANYGWPNVTLGTDYSTYDWPHQQIAGQHLGYTSPIFAWIPSIGVSNLLQVKQFNPRWDGDLLVASLKAASLFRLRYENGRIIYSEPIWIGSRIRDLAQAQDGTIVLWTDDASLLFLRVDQEKLKLNKRLADIRTPPMMAACMTCHHLGATTPLHLGPTLSGLAGRNIASDEFAKYSPALKKIGGVWTASKLKEFIMEPNRFANGTLMPKLDISAEDVDRIVEYLVSISATK